MDVQKVSAHVLKSDEVKVVPAVKAGAGTNDTASNKQLTSTQRSFVMPDYFFQRLQSVSAPPICAIGETVPHAQQFARIPL